MGHSTRISNFKSEIFNVPMSRLFLIPLVYFASILEISFAPHWQIAGAGPDLLALIAVMWTVKSTGWHALAATALVGLVCDLNSEGPLGIGMALYAAIAYGVIWWRRQVGLDRLPAQIAVVWTGVTAISISELAANRCLGQSVPPLSIAIERTAIVGLYTAMIAVPIVLVLSWRGERHGPAISASAS
jgi:rod shape-determining protein MreD